MNGLLARRIAGAAALTLGLPLGAHAQESSVVASATVVGRPLTIRQVAGTVSGLVLRVQLEGCGGGALTIDARHSDLRERRVANQTVTPGVDCRFRDFLLPLGADSADVTEYVVSLSQPNALLAPAVSQIVVPVVARRASGWTALGR